MAPSSIWLDVDDVAGAMETKAYSTPDRRADATSRLRSETYEALTKVLQAVRD
jgi:hypothetical protein